MTAISRYLLPPILNTIHLPTLSADGNVERRSSKVSKGVCRIILNHRSSTDWLSGCFSQNTRKAFREMTRIGLYYLKMRCQVADHTSHPPRLEALVLGLVCPDYVQSLRYGDIPVLVPLTCCDVAAGYFQFLACRLTEKNMTL